MKLDKTNMESEIEIEEILKQGLVYKCHCDDNEWYGTISNYENHITYSEFRLTGRGSLIRMYIGYAGRELWVSFPDLKKATTLSYPDDILWNKEELTEIFESIADGTTIAESIKILNIYNLIPDDNYKRS